MFRRLSPRAWLIVGVVATIVVGVVVALVVIDGDGDDVATDTTTTSEPATTESTDGQTTTTDDDTATTTGSTECPEPAVPGEVLAESDLDGDGTDEIFARVQAGGPRDVVGLFRRDGCEVVAATLAGAPAEFPVGASVRAIGGLQCGDTPGSIVVYTGESTDGETYDIEWQELRFDGSSLTPAGDGSGTASPGDELYTAASTFGCSG